MWCPLRGRVSMFSMSAKNLMIVQGGGPTAVFNASLASIICEAQKQDAIGRIYGARFGMMGLSTNDVIDLTFMSTPALDTIRHSPGASLGSTRFKPVEAHLEACLNTLQSLAIGVMVFLGGNGTMAGAQLFRDFCRSRNFDLQVMGAPKTIDNDICSTNRCPGFGSAARFVAQSTIDLAMDIQSLHQPVSIFETLGRDVGWLAAASILAKEHEDDAPHIICVPEIPFVLDEFLQRLDAVVKRIGWAVAVVSEGTCFADGTPVYQQLLPSGDKTPLRPLIGGVAQHLSGVVAQHLGLRCRNEKPGLIARSSASHVSKQDFADAELTGRECVRALAQGTTDFMISLLPLIEVEGPSFELLPLAIAGGPRRQLPAEWLRQDGLAVNKQLVRYMKPIVGPLRRYGTPLHASSSVS